MQTPKNPNFRQSSATSPLQSVALGGRPPSPHFPPPLDSGATHEEHAGQVRGDERVHSAGSTDKHRVAVKHSRRH